LKERKDTIYVGGPVAVNQMLLLVGTPLVPEASQEVTQDVYISSSWKVLERLMKNAAKDERFRIFAGYAGWAPNQLDFETSRGDWHVLKADAEAVFDKKPYGPIELVQWGRGCPFNCDFCSIKAFYGSSHPCRPIEDLVKELAGLSNKTVFFVDDNLYANKARFKQFLMELAGMNIKWACQISINIAQDDELLRLMRDSGCFLALVGIESFHSGNLKLMNKEWNTSNLNYDEAIKKIKSYGIMIYGTFVFGYDFDTADSFKYAVDFAIKHKFFIANFNPLYPMPGTPLYHRLENEKRLLFDRWWLNPDFYYGKSMFQPKGLSADDLEAYCFKAKREFNSWNSILHRCLDPIITHKSFHKTILYFYSNMINRKEIYKKQGKGLAL